MVGVVGSNPIVPTRILFGILLNDVFFADFSHNNTLSLKKIEGVSETLSNKISKAKKCGSCPHFFFACRKRG